MLNTFPTLLSWSPLAPFILRVVLGLIILDLGVLKFKSERADWIRAFEGNGLRPGRLYVPVYGALQIVGGLLLIIGLYTQIAALAFVILTGIELFIEYKEGGVLKRDIVFYILIFAIALSLVLSGAGAYAQDIPL